MDIFLLYLFTRLDTLVIVLVVASVFSLVLLFFALTSPVFSSKEEELAAKIVKRLAPASAILIFLAVATPTKEDVAFIVAGKVGIELAQSDEVKETSAKLYQLLHQKLDAALLEEQTDG